MNLLWGNSVALSWMWGLGLFFSVQFSLQYGLFGLLTFAIPNALGLVFFGGVTQLIARRVREAHFVAIVTPALKHLRLELARLQGLPAA